MQRTPKRALLIVAALLFVAPVSAIAGGPEIADQGARATGRGGAMTVKADDPSAIYYNPAGLALQRGTGFLLSNRMLYTDIEFRRARTLDWSDATHGVPRLVDFEHVRNEVPWTWLSPMAAVTSDFGLEDWTFAVGTYAPNAAGHLKYPRFGPQRYMMTEQDVIMLYYNASVAWKYKDLFGVGLSLQYVDVPRFNFSVVVDGNISPRHVYPDSSPFDMHVAIRGENRFGFTGILGAWVKPIRGLEIALAGRFLPIHVRTDSTLDVTADNLASDEPVKVLKGSVEDNRVAFEITFPTQLRGGIRWYLEEGGRELADIELDVQWEMWSQNSRYLLDAGVTTELAGQRVDIDQVAIPREFIDTVSIRLGGDVQVIPGRLWLRAGGFYESPAVRPAYAYLDALSFHRLSPSAGLTLRVLGADLSVAYNWVFQTPAVVTEEEARVYQQVPGSLCQPPYMDKDVCEEHYLGKPSAPANAGTYLSTFHAVNASLSFAL
jgi:long-chain fatty acid transport protein